MKYYAGIGSRKTPTYLRETIHRIAKKLEDDGYTLRSGGADGADTMFEEAASQKDIYLPWKAFNGNDSKLYKITSNEGAILASQFHPNWRGLSQAGKLLMIRNGYQVLGGDLKTPSDFIVCWTPRGGISGGTGQALRIANKFKIPIFNLFNKSAEDDLMIHVGLASKKLF